MLGKMLSSFALMAKFQLMSLRRFVYPLFHLEVTPGALMKALLFCILKAFSHIWPRFILALIFLAIMLKFF